MYEFHGWVSISDSTYEESDQIHSKVEKIMELIKRQAWNQDSITLKLKPVNGVYILSVNGVTNHKGKEAEDLKQLFKFIAETTIGSYGMLYIRNDEDLEFENCFRVLVLSRGELKENLDPFLSPCIPVIED